MKYVTYCRVSTKEQGESGLGLEAQKSVINNFVSKSGGEVISSYTDIESGANNNRPQLTLAIADAKKNDATLIIAKLDRLSRNVSFIYQLKDSDVKFVCCETPNANNLTIGILAIIAQEERELISSRTKAALAEKKKQGIKLGNPQNLTESAREKAYESNRRKAAENLNNKRAKAMIDTLIPGMSYKAAAEQLNNTGFTTSTGKQFSPMSVQRIYLRK